MRTLSHIEIDLLLDFFEESPGYVLDFTDRTFNEFTEREIGVRVKDLYQNEGLSKHKTLCKFCKAPGNEEKAYKLLSALMNYFDLKLRDQYQFNEQGEKSYVKCKEILRAFVPTDSRKRLNGLSEMIDKLQALYKDGAMFQLTSSEDKITIGLAHLAAFIETAIKCREWRIFGNPLVIRILTDLAALGGDSICPAETKLAENAWHEFSTKLNALLLLISKNEKLADAAIYFRNWLSLHPDITEKVGGYSFYRGISTAVLTNLVENFKRMAVASHPQHKDNLELMYCGIFNDEWDAYDFLPADGSSITLPQVRLGNLPTATANTDSSSGGEQNGDGNLVKNIAAVITPLFEKLDRNRLKPILENTQDIKNKVDPFDRYRGLESVSEAKRPLLRKAIDYSYQTPYLVAPLGRASGKKDLPTLAKMGEIVWNANPNDQAGFAGIKAFQTVLNEQAHRNER